VEGHSIGHSKPKKCICTCVLFQMFSKISLYSCKIVNKKEILHTVTNGGIYFSSDKVGIVYLVKTFLQIPL
jgi:hypothetical protein